MNWISSIKDKSTRLVSNFSRSAQIEETVESLNNASGLKTTGKPHRIELKDNSNKLEFEDTQRDYMTLMEVLRPLMKRVIYIDKLEDAVELVLSNPAKYLRQDPTDLTLPSREDFSNFNVFYEKNKPNEAFLTKILTFEPTLPQLFATDDHIGHEKKESMLRFLMRFVYVVIYFLENAEKERSKQSGSISNKENEAIAVPDKVGHRKESDDIDHDELFDGK